MSIFIRKIQDGWYFPFVDDLKHAGRKTKTADKKTWNTIEINSGGFFSGKRTKYH